jgi:chromosome segregation ATPase
MIKNLKSLFIVDDGSTKKAPAKTLPPKPEASSPAASKQPTPAAPAQTTEGERPGVVNKKFTNTLLNALEKANQPGFDYLEFKKALQNLKKLNMDDSTRFQSAYATAQSMNVTPQQLKDSAAHYLSVLTAEQQNFELALKGQQQTQIKDQEEQLPRLEAEVKRLEIQIKQLEEQIKKAKADQTRIKKSIEQAGVKLSNTKNDFLASYRAIADQIQSDVEDMERYLK